MFRYLLPKSNNWFIKQLIFLYSLLNQVFTSLDNYFPLTLNSLIIWFFLSELIHQQAQVLFSECNNGAQFLYYNQCKNDNCRPCTVILWFEHKHDCSSVVVFLALVWPQLYLFLIQCNLKTDHALFATVFTKLYQAEFYTTYASQLSINDNFLLYWLLDSLIDIYLVISPIVNVLIC